MTIIGLASALLGVIGLLLKWYLDPKRRVEHDIKSRKDEADTMGKDLLENNDSGSARRLSDLFDSVRTKDSGTPKR